MSKNKKNLKVRILHEPSGDMVSMSLREFMTNDLRGLYYTDGFDYPFDVDDFKPLIGVELGGTDFYVGDYVRLPKPYNPAYEEGALGEIHWNGGIIRAAWKVLLDRDKVHHRPSMSTIMNQGLKGTFKVIGNKFHNQGLLEERANELIEKWDAEKDV